jgi:hypothetical protein
VRSVSRLSSLLNNKKQNRMSTQNFRLLNNSFLSQTIESHSRAVRLSTDSVDKLRPQTAPALVSIYNDYLPFHNAYMQLNVAVSIADGTYKGKTLGFSDVLDTLPEKLRDWEPQVYSIYREDSPVATEIFPNKRTPFYDGPYDLRLLAVQALRDKLQQLSATEPALVPVQADVATFYTLAETTRQTQQANEGQLSLLRLQRDEQREATMNAFWGIVYGGLLRIYYNTPELILGFIDLFELYDNASEEPVVLSGNINSEQVVNLNGQIDDNNIDGNTVVVMKNTSASATQLYFYAADAPDKKPDGFVSVILNPGEELSRTIADIGFTEVNTFFNIYNPGSEAGSWEVEVEV